MSIGVICKCVGCDPKCNWAFNAMTCCGCKVILERCPYNE